MSRTIQKHSAASGSSATTASRTAMSCSSPEVDGDHVEPGVAEEHRARERSEGLEPRGGPQRGDRGGREREREPEVKTDPGEPIVVGDMPGRQREREPERPRDEQHGDQAQGRGQPARDSAAWLVGRWLHGGLRKPTRGGRPARRPVFRHGWRFRRHHRWWLVKAGIASSMLRLERHRLGPRVFVFGCRIHEWHLGVLVIAGAVAAALLGRIGAGPAVVAVAARRLADRQGLARPHA